MAEEKTCPVTEVVPAPGFQAEVADWMLTCFGEEIAADRIEHADRFIEEALELAQTIPGFTVERARALVEYVFGRPVGERGQEVGGVGVTLAALCNTYDLNIRDEWERELARVWTKVDAIRAKQAAKPVGSALPVCLSTRPSQAEGLREAVRFDLKWITPPSAPLADGRQVHPNPMRGHQAFRSLDEAIAFFRRRVAGSQFVSLHETRSRTFDRSDEARAILAQQGGEGGISAPTKRMEQTLGAKFKVSDNG